MISRLFQSLLGFLRLIFEQLTQWLVKLLVYCVSLLQDVFTWITEEWIRGWLEVLEFVLTIIPHSDMSAYNDVIIQLRLYWSQWNNLIPLNTALYCALIYIDIYNLVLCLKFVNLIFSKFVAVAKFFFRFVGI